MNVPEMWSFCKYAVDCGRFRVCYEVKKTWLLRGGRRGIGSLKRRWSSSGRTPLDSQLHLWSKDDLRFVPLN